MLRKKLFFPLITFALPLETEPVTGAEEAASGFNGPFGE